MGEKMIASTIALSYSYGMNDAFILESIFRYAQDSYSITPFENYTRQGRFGL